MIPRLTFVQRAVAWLLWSYERLHDLDEAEFNVIEHPELLRTVSLLRDYYYVKRAGDVE